VLLLVTILLVVVGFISLVIGFLQSSLLPIYISIGCSVVAAAMLLIFSRMTARGQRSTSDGPTPRAGPSRTEPASGFTGSGLLAPSPGETFAPDAASYGGEDAEMGAVDDDDFPIERYDSRRVGEILPLLAELDIDELDLVREREEQGKGRATVLARIDQLIDKLEAEDRQEADHRFDPPAIMAEPAPATHEVDEVGHGPAVEPVVASRTTQAVSVAALTEDDGYFPIEDYDDLEPSEILPLLPELDDDELVMVREREQMIGARSSILREIEVQLGSADGSSEVPDAEPVHEVVPVAVPVPEPSPVVTRAAAVKKAPAKRAPVARKAAPVNRAPAVPVTRKSPPAKKAAPARATPRKAAPVAATEVTRPAPATKVTRPAPATKIAATKVPATKVAATKVAATKVAATKVAPVRKAPARKVTPAKATVTKSSAAPAPARAVKATRKASKG